jgi:hypothetical protein
MAKFEETVMSDHEFAKWLKDRGWTGKYHHVSTATYYHNKVEGVFLAMTISDNSACTRRIFLNTEIKGV